MLQNILESCSLALHDGLTAAAEIFKISPEIKKAHRSSRAGVKKAKVALASAKTTARAAVREMNVAHKEERRALAEKQASEAELLSEKNKTALAAARDNVKKAKATGRAKLDEVRRRLEMARLQDAPVIETEVLEPA